MKNLRVHIQTPPSAARIGEKSADALREAAHAAELAAAEERGRAAGYAEAIAGSASTLEQAAEQYHVLRTELSEQAGSCAAKLATDIVRQLLRIEVPAGNYDLEKIVREVLVQGDAGYGHYVVRLNPADAERLADTPFRAGTKIEADEDVRLCDVRVETPQGVLVRELDACLRDIRERLLGGTS